MCKTAEMSVRASVS